MNAKELFLACLEAPASERAGLLDGADAEVRGEVEALLGAHASSEGLFEPVEEKRLAAGAELRRRLGPYLVGDPIGEGGMGIVYRAEQDFPRREVALKVLNRGDLDESRRRRFQDEADALARLDHPAITRVYEAGVLTAEDGELPYIAMELVDGHQLLDWVRDQRPEQAEILELVEQLATGVHFAHERGVIHRDLKPSNVLVTADGEPKVIDFGVARITDGGRNLTRVGELVGTLAYMSPEQTEGDAELLDARSDQYALGVIAYELLSGEIPVEVAGKSLTEAARRVRSEPPVPLRERVGGISPDLELVVGKALAKVPSDRYASTAAFAEDLGRVRRGEPVSIAPDTALRSAWRAARRHWLVTASAAGVVIGLIGMSLWLYRNNRELAEARDVANQSLWAERRALSEKSAALSEREAALVEARTARERAEEIQGELTDSLARATEEKLRAEAARSEADAALSAARAERDRAVGIETMYELLLIGSPTTSTSVSPDATVRDLLEDFAARTEAVVGSLSTRAAAHFVAGRLMVMLGDPARAEKHYRTSIAAARESQETSADRVQLVRSLTGLASSHLERGDSGQAFEGLNEARPIAESLPENERLFWSLHLDALASRAFLVAGDVRNAVGAARAGIDLLDAIDGAAAAARADQDVVHDAPPLAAVTSDRLQIGLVFAQAGETSLARELLGEVLGDLPRAAESTAARAAAHCGLAMSFLAEDRLDEAETAARQAWREAREDGSRTGIVTFLPTTTLANVLSRRGKWVEAEELTSEAIEHYRRIGNVPMACHQLSNRSFLRERLEQPERAREDAEASCELALSIDGPGAGRALDLSHHRLLGCALAAGDHEAALEASTVLCDVRRERFGEHSFQYVEMSYYRGRSLSRLGRTDLALEVLGDTRELALDIDDTEALALIEREIDSLKTADPPNDP